MKALTCGRCGQRVFFENVACGNCGATLGFVPAETAFAAFEIDEQGTWRRVGTEGPAQRPCGNYVLESVCNWMVPADVPHALCMACRTTDVIPALSKPDNRGYWFLLEKAKRRLFYSLLTLGLPAPNKAEDPEHGVSFQFLEEMTQRVMTGHDNGVITLNIAEADDARREAMRTHLHEPYRTLLGHFRHEIGHYYWDRLIDGSPWHDRYRALFGDERADYTQALQQHYAQPAADWAATFVSAYASAHPWEDWAECWAHYMHIVDGLETAASWGLQLGHALPGADPVTVAPLATGAALAPVLIEQWLPVSQFINAMDRSLGANDSYPFVLPQPVVDKLQFIHDVVGAAGRGETPMRFASAIPQADAAVVAPVPAVPATPNGEAPAPAAEPAPAIEPASAEEPTSAEEPLSAQPVPAEPAPQPAVSAG